MSAADGSVLADNTYWESTSDDDLGSPRNDDQFTTKLVKWADLTALDTMPRSEVTIASAISAANGESTAKITLTNRTNHIAFFLRAEVTKAVDGEEALPITYEDNYITLYPHEARTLVATFATTALDGGRFFARRGLQPGQEDRATESIAISCERRATERSVSPPNA